MLKLYFKITSYYYKNRKIFYFYNNISNCMNYKKFFNNVDFPIFISCRQIIKKNSSNIYGQFYIGPFFTGQGLTIANALRRTLLSELFSFSITSVQIQNVFHQYQMIRGLQESVSDILLNLKDLVFKSNNLIHVPNIGYLQAQGPCIIKAKHLLLPTFIQCIDPEQYIATLTDDGFLNLKFVIRQGKDSMIHINPGFDGYSFSKTNNFDSNYDHNDFITSSDSLSILNTYSKNLLIDSSFHSVIKVNYMIELLDFDKLSFSKDNSIINNISFSYKNKKNFMNKEIIVLEIWTNGSISPVDALKFSIKNLIRIFLKIEKSNTLNKKNKNKITTDFDYINIFNNLKDKYNSLKFKQSQTLSEIQGGGRSEAKSRPAKYLIQQLKYLINQL